MSIKFKKIITGDWIYFFYGLIILCIFFVWAASGDSPDNWTPWFQFYRSSDCAKGNHDKLPNSCYLWAGRPNLDPKNLSDALNFFKLTYTSTSSAVIFDKLNQPVSAADWDCVEAGSYNKKAVVEPENKDPRRGYYYDCWPKTPLPLDIDLTTQNPLYK